MSAFIEGERLYLRGLTLDDASEKYLGWMHDPAVMQYLESRFYPHSLESLRDFISQMQHDRNNVFLAMVLKDGDRHIGNIKLGPINWIHRFADIGLLIGEKDCWGKGYGTEAIRLLTHYAFN
ncbi:MAG: GNAT family N-acetyltransferase, partial [Anaerolineae bacterium]|nr:GNAT family N-acetyltransferase [Anaerolineae bacterium]